MGKKSVFPSESSATGPAGLKFVFDGVKTSVKGQYGQKSPNYAAVSGMRW